MTAPMNHSKNSSEEALIAAVEFETAVLVRNLEMLQRRSELYVEVDRAGYLLLRVLDQSGSLDIGTLSARLGLDPSTAGRQVGVVKAAGLVEKSPDPTDQRRTVVRVTEEGHRAMEAVRRRRCDATVQILNDWSLADLDMLAGMFHRYNGTIARRYLGARALPMFTED